MPSLGSKVEGKGWTQAAPKHVSGGPQIRMEQREGEAKSTPRFKASWVVSHAID